MNDWYSDPPDEPEYEAFFEQFSEVFGDEPRSPTANYDTLEEKFMDAEPVEYEQTVPDKCPHENEWGSCDQCDHEGDLSQEAI